MEKLLLALFLLSQKLHVIDYQHIHGAELVLKARQIPLLYGTYESVDKLLTAQELNYRPVYLAPGLMADGVQKVRFAKTGTAVEKQGIIRVAGRLTHGKTTGLSKPVAWPNYEILKRIVRMQSRLRTETPMRLLVLLSPVNLKLNCNQMTGALLCRPCEAGCAIITQKLTGSIVRTSDFQHAPAEAQHHQLVEPVARVGRVKRPRTLQYISKNSLNFLSCQTTLSSR
jgi:hypothetical protein